MRGFLDLEEDRLEDLEGLAFGADFGVVLKRDVWLRGGVSVLETEEFDRKKARQPLFASIDTDEEEQVPLTSRNGFRGLCVESFFFFDDDEKC